MGKSSVVAATPASVHTRDDWVVMATTSDPSSEHQHPRPETLLHSFGTATYPYREFVCGWGAAFVNITATFPLNKVMFRQQLYGINLSRAVQQLRKEGMLHLYRGLMPPLMQKTTNLAIMFGSYHQYRHVLQTHMPALSQQTNKSGAALMAGTTEALLAPFERVQTLLQDRNYHFRNTLHAFSELRTYGVAEYYRGLTPILLRNGPSNILFFLFRGEIKDRLPKTDSPTGNVVADFVSGGCLGAFISTVFFPLNVVKTKMQSQVGGKFNGLWVSFVTLYNERGCRLDRLYRGVHVNYTRSIISWGLINASYELFKKVLYSDD